ncbi:hypothetical protein HMPREF9123_1257 [Neisseria bacilliformis ATCC BAA-1200]|uniref:Uncharacterized protein n=1 Tax=Neisseria bacilliformis ATCC BAA-1200 TaxID=888742 RepID=F2BC02_9NEIS|nr:hypothetical protein HMPREF9123_1257 [Neisseria bacilliformis ATCC BAA-1200]
MRSLAFRPSEIFAPRFRQTLKPRAWLRYTPYLGNRICVTGATVCFSNSVIKPKAV